MPRAKLTFEERVWLEEALNKKVNHMEICRYLGISTYQLQVERKLGWIKKEQRYSAEAAEQGEKVTPADISTQANKEFILTQSEFKKDIKNILSVIKEKEITLDGQDQEKYHFHIRQLEKLIGGQK